MICDQDLGAAICVDPGESDGVLAFLAEHQLQLKAILLTHHHSDHAGGVGGIIAQHPCPVYGGKNDNIASVTQTLIEGDEVTFDEMGLSFRVLDIPAHTKGHIAYYAAPYLFCGDTLFLAGCGRLFEGSAEQMLQSLNKLKQCPDETLVYCAHEYTEQNLQFALTVEPNNTAIQQRLARVQKQRQANGITIPASMAEEKDSNPFLRCTEQAIIDSAEAHAGKSLKDEVAVFAELRHWKDNF